MAANKTQSITVVQGESHVHIVDGMVVIVLPLEEQRASKSGKTDIVASTRGFTSLPGDSLAGKALRVSVNVCLPK